MPRGREIFISLPRGRISAARQINEGILCRAAGFLSEPYSTLWPFGHRFSIVSAVSHVSAVRPPFFPTFRPCDHRFSRFGPANAVFASSWPICTVTYVIGVPGSCLPVSPVLAVFPRFGRSATVFTSSRPCNHRFPDVLADLHRYVRDRGARVTFPRFPPFWPFSAVSAVWPPFSRRLGRATTVFPALRPNSTVTYVTGLPGERLAVFPRFGRSATVFARFGRSAIVFQRFGRATTVFPRFGPANAVFAESRPCDSLSPVLAVFPRFVRATTIFPSVWPISTVAHVTGVPGSR